MRVIINDKWYGALKTLGERKQAFNEVWIWVPILEQIDYVLQELTQKYYWNQGYDLGLSVMYNTIVGSVILYYLDVVVFGTIKETWGWRMVQSKETSAGRFCYDVGGNLTSLFEMLQNIYPGRSLFVNG